MGWDDTAGFDDGVQRIGSDPFAAPEAQRDPARRLRGRLAEPVTVWTAVDADGGPIGLTVSSVLVVEGAPAEVVGVIGPLSDLAEALGVGRRFVVHLLASDQVRLAEQFAGQFPGDPFAEHPWAMSAWGPTLERLGTRASCTVAGRQPLGYGLLVRGRIDSVVLGTERPGPLVHYRGRYATVAARR